MCGLIAGFSAASISGSAVRAALDAMHRCWRAAPQWAQTLAGAWWLRRSVCSPEELRERMDAGMAAEALRDFAAEDWVTAMTGPLAAEQTLALAQIESMSYLRNQLLRDSDWASMDHSVELRTPLVDAWLLQHVQPCLSRFNAFPDKRLLADAPLKPLPREIVERRKTGFAIPVERWMTVGSEETMLNAPKRWIRTVADAYAG